MDYEEFERDALNWLMKLALPDCLDHELIDMRQRKMTKTAILAAFDQHPKMRNFPLIRLMVEETLSREEKTSGWIHFRR